MTNTDVSGQMPHRAVSPSLPQVEILDQVCLQVRPPDLSRLVQTCNHLHDVARHQLVLQHTRVDDRFQLPFACIFDHRLAWIAIEAGASVLLAQGADPVSDFIPCYLEFCALSKEGRFTPLIEDNMFTFLPTDAKEYQPLFTAIYNGYLGMVELLLHLGGSDRCIY
ncbi:hypothetical protein PgNI_11336 [Pyricularia grisea]|uniref:F-box domain-containing protein n=1 Tax=Pyricularia grisea TaxID=148305 RepID=A0A6P8APZ3_PYRGI|nr:hypothetical protein PgNI_11336 [Pyricularia grisea]TLD04101.1 hypothetical protein PgNI_11336 [Pyricularia grisea]